ncbi:MAG: crotonase/enoyl-CoA hydratase family protein [bacterium]|nr:crotonase/enoyl-CoA hydratase family protein [bacterium]
MPSWLTDLSSTYRHLYTRFDDRHGVLWCIMNPKGRPCFSVELLEDMRAVEMDLERYADTAASEDLPFRYVVFASGIPGVFNYGGDLEWLIRCLNDRDASALRRYARLCIDVLHSYFMNFNLPITTISLVQGDALGGGFEAALGGDVVIAEKSALFGFPEILFNLFPGMGAYNFLSRRIGMARTERMILGGKTFRAEELLEEGVLDVVAEDGKGENALYDYIEKHSRKKHVYESLFKVRRSVFPVRHEEMMEISELWVDTAMRIGPKDIRLMERLVKAQGKPPAPARTLEPVL